jgi:hypothetical protein
MQVKTILRFHLTPVRVTIIKKTNNNKFWQGCREKETLKYLRQKYKAIQLVQKMVWWLLKKLKVKLPYDPTIPLLGICWKECKSGCNKGSCMPTFIAALFTVAKLRNSQNAPLPMNGLRKCGIYIQS